MKIELEDIYKYFGPVRANDGISLTIESGVIQGLLGENGAGKTTLMKILSGYQPADRGTILLDGRPVHFRSPADAIAAGIGMLHQDPLDVPAFSTLENLALGSPGGPFLSRTRARRTLEALCQRFGFSLDPDAPVSSLTVGERQQLEMVRLLALGVRVIILDEPTTGISAPQKVLLFQALRQLSAEGLAVIFVSHKLDEVRELCSRVTVLRQGKVAGHLEAPFATDDMVSLMFGQVLGKYAR
ncbi:MAG: ATP-binding cassette domain-containing protein, partial [Chloroflexi bacterium]|nr:ATP-binding cassette domain-containing protein [Chloroflexota bacterium]